MLKEQLNKFYEEMEGNQFGGLLIFLPNSKEFVKISYGTGDNLLDEDEAEGFDDYIYIEVDKFDGTWVEDVDGGMMMLKMQEEWNGHYNICQHIEDALAFLTIDSTEALILQGFTH